MAILNPICADCGHDLQHHYAGAGNTGCSDGDCQCALFVSKNKPVTEEVDKNLTRLVTDISEGIMPEKDARIFLGLPPAPESDTMSTDEFTRLIEEQIGRSTSLLIDKAKEYASDTDRLHNFKVAAGLLGGTPEQALGGFLAKHIVSVFDMINSGKEYPKEVWNEKITDSINYLLILRAMQR
jgi:hypothetical protein